MDESGWEWVWVDGRKWKWVEMSGSWWEWVGVWFSITHSNIT